MTSLTVGVLGLLFFLGFANGTNDVSKGIATLSGSGLTTLGRAMLWGTGWTVLGSLCGILWGGSVLHTIVGGVPSGETLPEGARLSLMIGTAGWVFLSTVRGWPVSTTHAIAGSLLGATAVTAGESVEAWEPMTRTILLPLLLSPVVAGILTSAVVRIFPETIGAASAEGRKICLLPRLKWLVDSSGETAALAAGRACAVCPADSRDAAGHFGFRIGARRLHWGSGALLSFARGLNDTPKFVAVTLLAIPPGTNVAAPWLFLLAAVAIGAGSLLGGGRVTRVLGSELVGIDPYRGFLANAVSSLLVVGASPLGVPVSTTHVAAGAILGSAAGRGIVWGTVRSMAGAWLVTVPVSALVAGLLEITLKGIFR